MHPGAFLPHDRGRDAASEGIALWRRPLTYDQHDRGGRLHGRARPQLSAARHQGADGMLDAILWHLCKASGPWLTDAMSII
jgi:hypothetical protein